MSNDAGPVMKRADLIPWPDLNPRRIFLDKEIEELRATLKQDGMLQPVGVKMNEKAPHWIFAGERRWRASEGVLEELPVMVREITEAAARRLALTENIQNEGLTAMEEAWGIQRYLEASEKTQTTVAAELGKDQSWISNRLRLLRLPDSIQVQVQQGIISASQARDLILPFSKLPPELWTMLSEAVSTRLLKVEKAQKRALVDDEIRMEVSKVAVSMSGWLEEFIWNEEAWADDKANSNGGFPQIPKERWKKAPNGTIIRYQYGRYARDRKSARAFDAAWWEDERVKAAAAELKARAKREKEFKPDTSGPKDLDWSADKGPISAKQQISHWEYHLVLEPIDPGHYYVKQGEATKVGDTWYRLHADPTDIPAENLVLCLGIGGSGYHAQSAILCANAAKFEAAQRSMDEKETGMKSRKWATYLRKEKKESSPIDVRMHVVTLAALDSQMDEGILPEVAKDMGLPEWEEDWEATSDEMAASFIAWMKALKAPKRTELLQRTIYRVLYGLWPQLSSNSKSRVQLETTLLKELVEKVEFNLPLYQAKVTKTKADPTPPKEKADAKG